MGIAVTDAAITGVSTFGTIMVFIMLSAQLPAIYSVVTKTKSVEHLSVAPTVGQLANFVTWTIYAVAKGDPNILRVNVLGIAFAVGYLAVFFWYAVGRNRRLLYALTAALLLLVGALEAAFVFGITDETARQTAMASFAVACNVAMYAAPIGQLRLGLASMNPAALPLLLCLANTVTSGTWLCYGLFVGNLFVAGPNVAGCALNAAQLLVGAYITVAVSRDPTICKPLPGGGAARKAEQDDADDDAGQLLAGLRDTEEEEEDPLARGVTGRFTILRTGE